MLAMSVDGTMYTVEHSPMGLPSANVRAIREAAPVKHGVCLYERGVTDDRWSMIQWPGPGCL